MNVLVLSLVLLADGGVAPCANLENASRHFFVEKYRCAVDAMELTNDFDANACANAMPSCSRDDLIALDRFSECLQHAPNCARGNESTALHEYAACPISLTKPCSDALNMPSRNCPLTTSHFGPQPPLEARVEHWEDRVHLVAPLSTSSARRESLVVELFPGKGVFKRGLATGTFQLTGAELNYQSCAVCVRLDAGEEPFMATGGTVTVTSIGKVFAAKLSKVTFNGRAGCVTDIERVELSGKLHEAQ